MTPPSDVTSSGLRRLVATAEIGEVIVRFAHLQDEPDFDSLELLLASNATFDIRPAPAVMAMPLVGRASIREALEARTTVHHETAQRRHHTTNVLIDRLDDDAAVVRSFLTVILVPHDGDAPAVCGSGVYQDRLIRGEAGWLFAERVLWLDGQG